MGKLCLTKFALKVIGRLALSPNQLPKVIFTSKIASNIFFPKKHNSKKVYLINKQAIQNVDVSTFKKIVGWLQNSDICIYFSKKMSCRKKSLLNQETKVKG